MTQPAQPQPKKTSGVTILLLVVGGCFAFSLLMAVGQALGYGGVVLGLLAAGGCGYLLVKGPPERRKLAAGGAGLGVLFVVFGLMGASASRKKAEADAAATAAAQKKTADDKAGLEKAVAQLAALDANAAPNQLVAVCSEVAKLGSIPAQHASRCGDAFLAEGQAQLAAKHPSEALSLLQRAEALSTRKDEVAAAIKDATAAAAAARASSALQQADEALKANDLATAAEKVIAAQEQVAAGLRANSTDVALADLERRTLALGAVLKERRGPWDDATAIDDDDEKLEAVFWPLFEDLAAGRVEEAIAAKRESQPATWKAAVPDIRKQAKAEQATTASAIKTARYKFSARLGELQAGRGQLEYGKGGFTVTLPGVLDVDGDWHLALSGPPSVKREVSHLAGKFAGVEGYNYQFAAKPLSWVVPFPQDRADEFARAHQSAEIELLVQVTGAVLDANRPAYGGRGAVPGDEKSRTGAGRALVAKTLGWRILDGSRVVLESPR